ncbi:hypothetical protein QTP70_010239 [Hemibagrus guttatus]|uniref:Uncharacterized protein n=1 Tax=Hemibagrus guttatus TaxID=175788 RepID=A0AAE0R0X6_9TELE|nr:hypothetical protein QTP70_010239 [Hemibagrus guttatus]
MPLSSGQPLVSRFLCIARPLRPSCRPHLPSRDLLVVLDRWVADLQALSVAPTCLEFATSKHAFCLLPHELAEQERLHLVCPFRALKTYVLCSGSWANGCSVPGLLVFSHGPWDRHQPVCGGVGIDVPIASVMTQHRVASKGNYNSNMYTIYE